MDEKVILQLEEFKTTVATQGLTKNNLSDEDSQERTAEENCVPSKSKNREDTEQELLDCFYGAALAPSCSRPANQPYRKPEERCFVNQSLPCPSIRMIPSIRPSGALELVGSSKVSGIMSSSYISGRSTLVLRRKTRAVHESSKDEEEIVEEKAYCMYCFAKLTEDDEVVKSVCSCTAGLLHVTCTDSGTRNGGNFCDYCEKEIHDEAVTLHRSIPTSTRSITTAKKKKWNFFPCLRM